MALLPQVLDAMRAAATRDPSDFVDQVLFAMPPFAFRSRPAEYEEFREEVAARLGVEGDDVVIVGSARLGFSLNPDHLLTQFTHKSDIDLVIVSSLVFDAAWEEMLANSTSIALANEDERRRLKKTRENLFQGYFRPDHVPLGTFLGREWFPSLSMRFNSIVARTHQVSAWLFKSKVHAKGFYTANVLRVRENVRRLLELRGDL
jgi:hypothetical protein